MKKLYILIFLFLSSTLFSNELAWVNEQVEAIKPARKGIIDSSTALLKDPFIFIKKKDLEKNKKNTTSKISTKSQNKVKKTAKAKAKTFLLRAIINKSALINDKWYKLNSYVDKYKLSKVTTTSVWLTKNKTKLVLTTKSKNSTIKFNSN